MNLSESTKKSLAEWFGGGDTGASSKTLVITALTGFAPPHAHYPCDPSDFGRCARLIERIPEVRDAAFPILENHGEVWPRLIRSWDHLHKLLETEFGINFTKILRGPSATAETIRYLTCPTAKQIEIHGPPP